MALSCNAVNLIYRNSLPFLQLVARKRQLSGNLAEHERSISRTNEMKDKKYEFWAAENESKKVVCGTK